MKRLIITILLLLALCGCERNPYVRYEADADVESLDMKVYVKDGYSLNRATGTTKWKPKTAMTSCCIL